MYLPWRICWSPWARNNQLWLQHVKDYMHTRHRPRITDRLSLDMASQPILKIHKHCKNCVQYSLISIADGGLTFTSEGSYGTGSQMILHTVCVNFKIGCEPVSMANRSVNMARSRVWDMDVKMKSSHWFPPCNIFYTRKLLNKYWITVITCIAS